MKFFMDADLLGREIEWIEIRRGLTPGNQKGYPESSGGDLRASSKSSKVGHGKRPHRGGPRNWKRETGNWLASLPVPVPLPLPRWPERAPCRWEHSRWSG